MRGAKRQVWRGLMERGEMNGTKSPKSVEPTVSASCGPACAGLLNGPVFFALAAWF